MIINRKLTVLAALCALWLVLLVGAVAQAQPLPPASDPAGTLEQQSPEARQQNRPPLLGLARVGILSNTEAKVDLRVRGGDRTITIVAGRELPLVVEGRAGWAREANGTATLRLEVEQKAADGTWTPVGSDQKQETKTGPARAGGAVRVKVPFQTAGTYEIRARVMATARPSQGHAVADRKTVTLTVQVIDPSQLGSISGQVTAEGGGAPLEGIHIGVINLATRHMAGRAKTAADGTYTIDKLRPGRYIVRAQPPRDSLYQGEFYDNVQKPREARPITIEVGSKITGIDFALATKP